MSQTSRRDFLKSTVTASVLAGTAKVIPAQARRRSATDLVNVGNSGVSVTRLAFGTGTFGGSQVREMGRSLSRTWSAMRTTAESASLRPPRTTAAAWFRKCWPLR
jgi:hypothetical protein